MSRSLLPSSATAVERAIEASTQRIGAVPTPLSGTWNPETCPAHLLPWLAWALSVDNWDTRWSEQKKRAVIRESVMVHRKKGTRSALERALGALSVRIEFQEWFEPGADDIRPHTFTLTTLANESLTPEGEAILDQNLYDTVFRVVDAVKPVRSHYHLRVGANYKTRIQMAPAVQGGSVTRERARSEVGAIVRHMTHKVGVFSRGGSATRPLALAEVRPIVRQTRHRFGAFAHGASFVRVAMEAI